MQEAGWDRALLPLLPKPRNTHRLGSEERVSGNVKDTLGDHAGKPTQGDQRIPDAVQQKESAEGHHTEHEDGQDGVPTWSLRDLARKRFSEACPETGSLSGVRAWSAEETSQVWSAEAAPLLATVLPDLVFPVLLPASCLLVPGDTRRDTLHPLPFEPLWRQRRGGRKGTSAVVANDGRGRFLERGRGVPPVGVVTPGLTIGVVIPRW